MNKVKDILMRRHFMCFSNFIELSIKAEAGVLKVYLLQFDITPASSQNKCCKFAFKMPHCLSGKEANSTFCALINLGCKFHNLVVTKTLQAFRTVCTSCPGHFLSFVSAWSPTNMNHGQSLVWANFVYSCLTLETDYRHFCPFKKGYGVVKHGRNLKE